MRKTAVIWAVSKEKGKTLLLGGALRDPCKLVVEDPMTGRFAKGQVLQKGQWSRGNSLIYFVRGVNKDNLGIV
jgi:hypothetical protein